MEKKEIYAEPIMRVVNSVGETMLIPQSVCAAVVIDYCAYRSKTRVTQDVKDAIRLILRRNPVQPSPEIADKMCRIAKRINDKVMKECDEVKTTFIDLVAKGYTELLFNL